MDVLDILGLLFVELAEHLFVEHLGKADDGVERRAQFVAHVGQELRLVLVGHFQLAALLLDFLEQAGVGDRDRGLVGEGAQKCHFGFGKSAFLHPAQGDDAERCALAQQWHTQERAVAMLVVQVERNRILGCVD